MNLEDLARQMGMNPDELNQKQKDVVGKASKKVDDKDAVEQYLRLHYSGLFPNWKV